ncbi:MAG: hypothetical protein JW969_09525 [Spirochaetales bacterium]|nr:hypothetical protein [Spirochaetales bacterium]
MGTYGKPDILIPYPGPCTLDSGCQDIFVYLRPESNGVLVESTLLKVIKNDPHYNTGIKLIYLANIHGTFIVTNRIVEEHYLLKEKFARKGKSLFTPFMQEQFVRFFNRSFEEAPIVGSYEALNILGFSEDQLFRYIVEEQDMLVINGQNIKKINELFVVNYDIPALLHKNYKQADIAVMIFRSNLEYNDFHILVEKMTGALIQSRVLARNAPFSRVFHYSKGPFEQVLDAIGYLYHPDGSHISLKEINYCSYLMQRGIDINQIFSAIRHPIMLFKTDDNKILEDNLICYTYNDSFEEAYKKYNAGIACAVL